MILAIDIGNTNIVVGCMDGDRMLFEERLYTDVKKTELEYAISFKYVLELYEIDVEKLEGGILSSVAPPVTSKVQKAVEKVIGKEIMVVGPGVKTGLDIKIDNPAQLGSDLVVGAVAGVAEYGCPLVIIDMGTATSFTVINEKRQVIGGMIMPGIMLALESLSSGTSQLPKIGLQPPRKLIGSNTVDCMRSGVLYGNAACLDGMIFRIREELKTDLTVVATGGLASSIIPYCREKILIDDGLLLKGLKLIYYKNRG